MSELLQIFSGNPLSTFIGKKVEAATRSELETEDWALNLDICDIINQNDDDAKDAVRAIRKRLQQIEQDRNFTVTNRTLTLLETCVNNCSRRFHVLVMAKDFIQDLVKLIGPKNNPPIDLQERVLSMIERWAHAFKGQPELSGVIAVYNDLKSKGVTFPAQDPNSTVPIQTPQRSVPPQQVVAMHPPQPTRSVLLEGQSYNKIEQDLSVVRTSIEMFDEILNQLESNKCEESDWTLAVDMDVTCRQMKARIVDLIERVNNEDFIKEFLSLNDELNILFTRYERQLKNRAETSRSVRTATTSDSQGPQNNATSSSVIDNELSLIDFNTNDSSSTAKEAREAKSEQLPRSIQNPFDSSAAGSALSSSTSNEPIARGSTAIPAEDTLAKELDNLLIGPEQQSKSRNSKNTNSALPEEISSVREQDFAEIENWLKTDSGGDASSMEPISIPNSEFDNFIASRAMAGSSTNTQTMASSSSTAQSASSGSTNRKPEPSV